MSEQFYCCVFSCIDQYPATRCYWSPELTRLVVLHGAVVLIDYIDRRTALVEDSGNYRSSLPTVVYLLQLSVTLLVSLSEDGELPRVSRCLDNECSSFFVTSSLNACSGSALTTDNPAVLRVLALIVSCSSTLLFLSTSSRCFCRCL